jgi:hypothetical protein
MIERDWGKWADAEIERMRAGSWSPVDLRPVLDEDEPACVPTILRRSDGHCLIYPGKLHSLSGETESLKTWMAVAGCAERLGENERVLYVDFEDSARVVVERLRSLGVTDEAIADGLSYVRPDEPLTEDAAGRIEAMLYEQPYSLAVLDGLTEALALQGLNPNDNRDIALWVAMLPRRLQRTGAAVLSIDHMAKNGEGRFALGAQHKLAGLDGAAYTVAVLKHGGRGQDSAARLTISKDRPGFVRAASAGSKTAAEVRLVPGEDGALALVIEASSFTGGKDPLGLSPAERRVLDALGGPDAPRYPREVGDRVVEMGWSAGLHRVTVQKALDALTVLAVVDGADGRWWRTDV